MEHVEATPFGWLLFYSALVFCASLVGGWLVQARSLTHGRLQMAVSAVAGLMLGMALLHFVPHAFHKTNSLDGTMMWALAGFLVMFFLQRFFHYHHHDVPDAASDPEEKDESGHDDSHGHDHAHSDGHEHEHRCHHAHSLAEKSARQLSWVGTVIGLSLHSLLDGIALAAAVVADAHVGGGFVGLGAALAIVLHKPFDAMAIAALMTSSGTVAGFRKWLNVLFALVSPVGMLLFALGAAQLAGPEVPLVGWALAFCAGTFLCIAASDLLPELQFHSHDRLKLSLALAVGLGISLLIGLFETSGHDHSSPPSPASGSHEMEHGAAENPR
jgi:zinc and cadmium transporter